MSGGFPGPVYAVNPAATELDGVPCVPSAAALPGDVDLAVIATPAAAVAGIAEECGRRGVKGLVVLAAGFDGAGHAELLDICRHHGMRMVGPASFGVADTRAGLDATFAARHPEPGSVGLALQSTGGAGFTLAGHLSRIGVGISSLVSLGDKDDVAGTDMLLWWESDSATKLALLYLESITNPLKSARTARRVSRSMPVLTVIVGRSATGPYLLGARAPATPLLTRQALFQQAGLIATANLGELLDAAVLLASQPVPAGPRVAVVSNTRGGAVVAADACGDAGLQVARLAGDTQRALRDLLPRGATVAGPVDTTLLIDRGIFGRCLELAGADPSVDAVLALTVVSAGNDPVPEVSAARLPVPVAAAVLDQAEVVRLLPGPGEDSLAVPAYAYAESAAGALGHAARYGMSRLVPLGNVPELDGLRQDRANDLVEEFLVGRTVGGWLPLDATVELLRCYGVLLADSIGVVTEDAAVAAAARFGAGRAPGGRARPGPRARRRCPADRSARRGRGAARVPLAARCVRPAADRGHRQAYGRRACTEVTISMLHEEIAGPAVLLGARGAAADALADRAARLAPMTDSDADELIRSIRAAPLLLGHPGAPGADLAALRDLLLRVSQLADDLPQIAELELSPVFARPDGVQAVDARIRLQAAADPADAHLRRLR